MNILRASCQILFLSGQETHLLQEALGASEMCALYHLLAELGVIGVGSVGMRRVAALIPLHQQINHHPLDKIVEVVCGEDGEVVHCVAGGRKSILAKAFDTDPGAV